MTETPLAAAITEAIAYRNRAIAGSDSQAVNAETMRQVAAAYDEHATDDDLSRNIGRCLDRWRSPRGTHHEAISLVDSALSRYVAGRLADEGARVPRPQMRPPKGECADLIGCRRTAGRRAHDPGTHAHHHREETEMTTTATTCCIAVHRQGWTGTVRDLTLLIGPADRAADLQRLGERMATQNGRVQEVGYQRASELAQHHPHTLHGLSSDLDLADLDWLGLPGPHHEQVSHSAMHIPRRVERCQQATAALLAELDAEAVA